MKVFFGVRDERYCRVYVWDTADPQRPMPLDTARELWNHSPDGFEWGYSGSGPAQLALAMLYAITQDGDFAISMHQDVKADLVASLPHHVWARSEEDILLCALKVARTVEAKAEAAHHLATCRNRAAKREAATNG